MLGRTLPSSPSWGGRQTKLDKDALAVGAGDGAHEEDPPNRDRERPPAFERCPEAGSGNTGAYASEDASSEAQADPCPA
jgi:hypothetical protein